MNTTDTGAKEPIDIVFRPCSQWGIDQRNMRELFAEARKRVATAMSDSKPIDVSNPYEAESVWLVARCKGLRIRFFSQADDKTLKAETQNDFWRIFSSPLREIDLLRSDVEEWEREKQDISDNPIDTWLDDEDID